MLCVVNIPISGHKINTTLTIVIITSYSSSHGGPSSADTIPPPPHLNTSSSSCAHFLFQHEPKEIPQAEGFTVHLVICYTLMAPTKVIHLGPSLANIIHRLGRGRRRNKGGSCTVGIILFFLIQFSSRGLFEEPPKIFTLTLFLLLHSSSRSTLLAHVFFFEVALQIPQESIHLNTRFSLFSTFIHLNTFWH